MLKKITTIIIFFFVAIATQAQVKNDSTALFNKLFFYRLLDVQQQKITTIHTGDKPLLLFIFLSPECPLCQNYTKTINQLQEQFKMLVAIYGIVPGKAYSVKDLTIFRDKYLTTFNLFIDTDQSLTHYLNATVTPQGILLDSNGNLLYTGAIDDWVLGQGKKKIRASKHYIKDAIEQSLQQAEIAVKKTTAYGCRINDF